MIADPRAALDRLVAALEAHFDAVSTRRSDDDPRIDDAYAVLADAFEVYDEALERVYGEMTPFMLDDHDDDDELDEVEDLDPGLDDTLDDDDLDDIDDPDLLLG